MLRTAFGVDFAFYKGGTTMRRITRRMMLRRMESLEDYVADLKKSPGELRILYHDLLIKVTGFFRDPRDLRGPQARRDPLRHEEPLRRKTEAHPHLGAGLRDG